MQINYFYKVQKHSYFYGLDLIERSVLTAHISSVLPNNTSRSHFSKKSNCYSSERSLHLNDLCFFHHSPETNAEREREKEIGAERKRDIAFGQISLPCVKTIGR